MVFNRHSRQLEPCAKCVSARKEEVRTNPTRSNQEDRLESLLGFPNQVLSSEYEFASIILEVEKPFLEEESLANLEEELEKFYGSIVTHTLTPYSLCFGLGIKGRLDRLIFPLQVRAYREGYRVHRVVSLTEYNRLCNREDPEVEEMVAADFLFILINEGCSNAELAAGKGLMQMRSLRGRGTVFVTTWQIQACSALLSTVNDQEYGLAKPVFVDYRRSASTPAHSNYIQRLLGVKNASALNGDERVAAPAPDAAPSRDSRTRPPSINFAGL